MKIELITTKKKLSKSIISQMGILGYSNFENAVPLGFLLNTPKRGDYYILTKVDDRYLLLNARWEKRGTYAGYNKPGHRGEFIKRISPEKIDDWFDKYNKLVELGKEKGQVYI